MSAQYQQQITALLDQYRRLGIVLHRPYPPNPHEKAFSKFGGNPNLPAEIDWPRGIDPYGPTPKAKSFLEKIIGLFRSQSGPPLHFLAQIDCSALPANQNQLPTSGALFFFGRVDDESVWDDSAHPNDSTRVIYVDNMDRSTPPRMPPKDTWQIHNRKLPSLTDFDRYEQVRLTTDPEEMQTFPEWPMVFSAVDSYPTGEALMAVFPTNLANEERFAFMESYDTTRQQRIEAEIEGNRAKLGYHSGNQERIANPLEAEEEAHLPAHKKGRTPWVFMPADIASVLPEMAVFPTEMAAHIGWHIQETLQAIHRRKEQSSEQILALEQFFEDAKNWISSFEAFSFSTRIGDNVSAEFFGWLSIMATKTYLFQTKVKGEEEVIELPVIDLHRPYWYAISQIARLAATNAELFDALPASFFSYPKHIVHKYNPLVGAKNANPHQMLGHFASSQNPFPIDSQDVPLLHLYSDPALNFMFWDVGEATFFVKPDDLSSRSFDQAWATIQG